MNSEPTVVARQLRWLAWWTSLLAFGLLASTWPLWLGPAEFPQIPLLPRLILAPPWVDWLSLAVLLGGLAGVLAGTPRVTPVAWLCVLTSGFVLVVLNQHRLQPWLYQLLFFGLIIVLSKPQRARSLLIGIVVSVYVYSALGKFDAEFLHTVGQQFWNGMLRIFGRPQGDGAEVPVVWIALLPLTELMLAAGLAWRPTRAVAGGGAMGFHLALLLLLSPLGLDHSWGVVLWNLQFAGQAWILFVWPAMQRRLAAAKTAAGFTPQAAPPSAVGRVPGSPTRWGNRLATGIAAAVIILPSTERLGFWDHWTSWALYAPHSSRVEVWIAGTAVAKLPASLRTILPSGSTDALWVRIPLERWSLAETKAPIYPQARFQLGVALELARRVESEYLIKAVVRGVAARWDGRRRSREYVGSKSIEQAARQLFWLNVQPRDPAAAR